MKMKSLMKVAVVLCVGAVLFAGCKKEEPKAAVPAAETKAEASEQATAEDAIAALAEVAEEAVAETAEPAAPTMPEEVQAPVVDEVETLVREAAEIAEKVDGVKPSEEEIKEMLQMFALLPAAEKEIAIAELKEEIAKAKAELAK